MAGPRRPDPARHDATPRGKPNDLVAADPGRCPKGPGRDRPPPPPLADAPTPRARRGARLPGLSEVRDPQPDRRLQGPGRDQPALVARPRAAGPRRPGRLDG